MTTKTLPRLALALFILSGVFTACGNDTETDPLKDISYGASPLQTFDLWLPGGTDSAACIVFLHGGFYVAGDKAGYPVFLKDYSDEVVFASLNYRTLSLTLLPNGITIDTMLDDIGLALSKIKEFAAGEGIDITKVIITGHSSGAHLALLYSYKHYADAPVPIAAALSLAGPADFSDDVKDEGWTYMETYSRRAPQFGFSNNLELLSRLISLLAGGTIKIAQQDYTQQTSPQAWNPNIKNIVMPISPIYYTAQESGVPPTILAHAPDDDTVPYNDAVRLYAALGGDASIHKFFTAAGGHSLEADIGAGTSPIYFTGEWVEEVKQEIDKYIRAGTAASRRRRAL